MLIVHFFSYSIFRVQQTVTESPSTPYSGADNTLRTELVNALSSNHKKRKEITLLRDELNKLNSQLLEQKTVVSAKQAQQKSGSVDPDSGKTVQCDLCEEHLNRLNQQCVESAATINELNQKLDEVAREKVELQTNMAELVKNFDRRKAKDVEAQNAAMHQLADDAKEAVRNELQALHETEKAELHEEIKKLGGELLYTKDEYVKLCEEMKTVEENIRKDMQNHSQLEREELKFKLETEYKEKLTAQENQLTSQHLEHVEKEKRKLEAELELVMKAKVDQAVALAQCQSQEQYAVQKREEVAVAVRIARAEWEAANESKTLLAEDRIEKLKEEWKEQQNVSFSFGFSVLCGSILNYDWLYIVQTTAYLL